MSMGWIFGCVFFKCQPPILIRKKETIQDFFPLFIERKKKSFFDFCHVFVASLEVASHLFCFLFFFFYLHRTSVAILLKILFSFVNLRTYKIAATPLVVIIQLIVNY